MSSNSDLETGEEFSRSDLDSVSDDDVDLVNAYQLETDRGRYTVPSGLADKLSYLVVSFMWMELTILLVS